MHPFQMNIQMFRIIISIITIGMTCPSYAQVGKYSESDIKLQTEYLETELAKYQLNSEKQRGQLEKLIEKDRSNDAAYYQLSRLDLDAGNLKNALTYADKAIKINANNKWYYLLAADISELDYDYMAANDYIEKAINIDPENSTLKFRIAHNFLKNGNDEKSLKSLNEIQNNDGVSEKSSYLMLDIYNQSNRFKEGIGVLEKLIDRYPSDVDHLNNLANQYELIGNSKKALEIRNSILEIDPENVESNIAILHDPQEKNSDDSNYLFAIKPLISNSSIPFEEKIKELIPYVEDIPVKNDAEYNNALRSISESLVANYPDEAKAHAIRGDIMYLTGEPSTALKSYDKTLALNNKVYAVWAQKMEVLYTLSDYNELQKFSEKSIDYYPNQKEAYFWYKLACFKNKDFEAASLFNEDLQFMTNANQDMKFYDTVALALKSVEKGNAKEGLEILNKLPENFLNADPFALEIYADALHANGNSEDALKLWKKAQNLGNLSTRINDKIQ